MQGGPHKACPVCQQWNGSSFGAVGLSEPSQGQIRRSNRSRRKPLSDEHKEKIRAALAGRKRKPLDEEHKRCAAPLGRKPIAESRTTAPKVRVGSMNRSASRSMKSTSGARLCQTPKFPDKSRRSASIC